VEWRAFVDCAREGFLTGERLDKEFYAKIAAHQHTDAEIDRTLRKRAWLLTYRKDGKDKLAIWDPGTELMVIARLPEGTIFNAFRVPEMRDYAQRLDG
jgi:hypothetical protein